ncbi:MAG: hypothetical protein IJ166_06640 [Prevotella sp.]|nr:hypothetical protein [Prevotella sp.]
MTYRAGLFKGLRDSPTMREGHCISRKSQHSEESVAGTATTENLTYKVIVG